MFFCVIWCSFVMDGHMIVFLYTIFSMFIYIHATQWLCFLVYLLPRAIQYSIQWLIPMDNISVSIDLLLATHRHRQSECAPGSSFTNQLCVVGWSIRSLLSIVNIMVSGISLVLCSRTVYIHVFCYIKVVVQYMCTNQQT